MTPQQYVQITRAASALREASLVAEIARLQVGKADATFAAAMRAAGFNPATEHRFDDDTLTITPVLTDNAAENK